TYSGNFSEEALALLSRSYGFTESADAIRTLGSLDRIDDEGIDELFGLSQQIVELYHLGVQPEIQNTETDISKLSYIDKIEKALKYSNAIDEIKEEIGDIRLLALQMASVAGVMIALAATGYGAAAEALGFVLLAVGAAFSGTQLLAGIIGLVKFLTTVDDANTEEDLKKCGKIFGEAIAKIGVDGLFFALSMFGLKKASVKFTTKTVVDNGLNSKKWSGKRIEEKELDVEFKKNIFKYKYNPSENPKVLQDAREDPNAVYGYRPREDGTLKHLSGEKFDWTDPVKVEGYQKERLAYIAKDKEITDIIIKMKAANKSPVEIAKSVCDFRNQTRLQSYINEDGTIKNMEGYKGALERCKTRSYESLIKQGKTPEEIIESSVRTNPAMDACCGLYDTNYETYNIK
ncbi:MAG: hypothetical protein PUJ82_16360, partial [Spirochaetales bacterium]|nr:hypothetical protein [Spirochaetales bacterium]